MYAKDLPLRLRGRELAYLMPDRAILKTIVVKGLPMGLQMIVVSASALALVGLVNREGVDTTAAFGVAMQLWTYLQMPAMALGAAVSAMAAQNIGAGRWDRVSRITRAGSSLAADHRRAGRPADARRPPGASPVHRRSQPGAANRPPYPAARDVELPGVRGDDGAVRDRPRQRRGRGPADHPRHRLDPDPLRLHLRAYRRLEADAIWISFPVSSLAQPLDGGSLIISGRLEEGEDGASQRRDEDEAVEEALANAEPGGALNPAG